MKENSITKKERNQVDKKKSLRKKKRKVVQKNKLIDAPYGSNRKTVLEEQIHQNYLNCNEKTRRSNTVFSRKKNLGKENRFFMRDFVIK